MSASRKAPCNANEALPEGAGVSLSLPPSLFPRGKLTRALDDSPSITGSARILIPPRRDNKRGKEVGSMLEAAQEAEEGGCEAAGRGGRLVLLLPPSATIIPAVKRKPMALPLPMFLVWLAGNAQTVPCVGGGRVVRCTRSEGDIARRHEGLGNDNCSRSRRRQACKPLPNSHKDAKQTTNLTSKPPHHKDRKQLSTTGMAQCWV